MSNFIKMRRDYRTILSEDYGVTDPDAAVAKAEKADKEFSEVARAEIRILQHKIAAAKRKAAAEKILAKRR